MPRRRKYKRTRAKYYAERQWIKSQRYKTGPRRRASYRKVARGSDTETKYVDGFLNIAVIHPLSGAADDTWADTELNPQQTTAIYGCLPIPRQGNNYSDRQGRKIYQKKITIRGHINWPVVDSSAVPTNQGFVRICIIKDKRTNSVTLSGENVIGPGIGSDGLATTSGDGSAINLLSNPDGWNRYQIMEDKTFRSPAKPAWGDNTNAGNSNSMDTPFKFTINCNCYVNFDATTGAIGSVIDNSFHLLAAETDNTGDVQITYYSRTSFTG